jgi:hypothetical protein
MSLVPTSNPNGEWLDDIGKKGETFQIGLERTASDSCFCTLIGNRLSVFSRTDADALKVLTVDPTSSVSVRTEGKSSSLVVSTGKGEEVRLSHKNAEVILTWGTMLRAASFSGMYASMGDFDILAVLGRGYYGKVQLCRRKSDEKVCAIKTIHKARLVRSGKVQRVFTERSVLAKCKHPFIVEFYEAFQSATKVYLVLEYARGGELLASLERRCLVPEGEVQLYVAELALALDYLHGLGVIFRDVSPENVVLDEEGHVKLTDFVLAKELGGEEETTGTVCGTLDYLAPEVARGGRYGREVDWWQLGVLAYELLFGEAPFQNENRARCLQAICGAKVRFPRTAPAAAVSFISHLLEKDPRRRGNLETIRAHPWLSHLDFEKVLRRGYRPEYVPRRGGENVTPNVDAEVEGEQPMDSLAMGVEDAEAAEAFEGFSCVAEQEEVEVEEEEEVVGMGSLGEDLGGLSPSTL